MDDYADSISFSAKHWPECFIYIVSFNSCNNKEKKCHIEESSSV